MTGGVMFGAEHDIELLKAIDWENVAADPSWKREHLAFHYFFESILRERSQNSWTIDGCSFSQRGANVMLVVKGTHEDTPYVAFVTERTPTGCVVTFCRLWLEQRVKWHPDKFR
jgi:hypothetical protein